MKDETVSFPFFNLPILIQWKILRQYISLTDKIHILSTIPDFSCLLESQESWPTLTIKKIKFLEWIRLLRPGIYFDPEMPEYKIQVLFDEVNLTLSICYFSFQKASESQKYRFRIRPHTQVIQYLTQLKNRLTLYENNVITYYSEEMGFITINHNLNLLFRYDYIYKLKNNECIIRDILLKSHWNMDPKNEDLMEVLFIPTFKLKLLNDKVIAQHEKFSFVKYTFLPYQGTENLQSFKHTVITLTINNEVEIQIQDFDESGYILWLFYEYLKIYPPWSR